MPRIATHEHVSPMLRLITSDVLYQLSHVGEGPEV
jgi:hypothetical protein